MIIGVPAEQKDNERRVAMTPAGVSQLVRHGHRVLVEHNAGAGSGFTDDAYTQAGADIASDATQVWGEAGLIVKVKEPIAKEYDFLRPDLLLFTYLHLAANPALTRALLEAGTTAIAYETVQKDDRSLPLLSPMSEIAGNLAIVAGAQHLLAPEGGRGILLGGVPGTPRADVVILGGGVAGTNAAQRAIGLGARVTVIDLSLPRLRELDALFGSTVDTRASTHSAVGEAIANADLVIGSVLVPGAAAPRLVTDDMVATMKPGAVLVDIAIDQGGCFENSHPTTHSEPTFAVHDALFYCVANMPGAVPRTATLALTNATLPYVDALASGGEDALVDSALARGVSTAHGELRDPRVAA